jgi:hypothetical protein
MIQRMMTKSGAFFDIPKILRRPTTNDRERTKPAITTAGKRGGKKIFITL